MKMARIFAVLSFLWTFFGSVQAADKIVADFGGLGGFQGTTWIAKDLKIFDKHGLDVDLVMITGGARSCAWLVLVIMRVVNLFLDHAERSMRTPSGSEVA